MRVGENVSNVLFLRRGFGLTQDYLAKELGISRPTFSKKEKGQLDWTKTEMEKLTVIFQKYNKRYTMSEIFLSSSSLNANDL